MNNTFFIFSFICAFCYACTGPGQNKRKVQSKKLYGWWTIETIIFDEENMKSCYMTNMVKIEKEGFSMPSLNPNCLETMKKYGLNPHWSMNEDMDSIYLNGVGWSGSYKYDMNVDKWNKNYRIQISGNNKYISMLRIW